MANDTYTFFGVQRELIPFLDTKAGWFGGPAFLMWEKDGYLYHFEMDANGQSSTRWETGLRVDHGLEFSDGQYLFLALSLHWAQGETIVLQNLQTNTEKTKYLLKAWDFNQKRNERSFVDLTLYSVRRPHHPAMRFLANPNGVQPDTGESWGAWGMPNGQLMVGPWSAILDELDELRRSSWDNLDNYQKTHLIATLAYYRNLPRQVRIDALKAHYNWPERVRNDNAERNQRSNAHSWASRYFGLDPDNDPMVLPWVR